MPCHVCDLRGRDHAGGASVPSHSFALCGRAGRIFDALGGVSSGPARVPLACIRRESLALHAGVVGERERAGAGDGDAHHGPHDEDGRAVGGLRTRGGHHAAHHARLARRRSTARLPWDFYRFKMARLGCYCTGGRLSNEGRIGRANERARVSSPVPSRACVVARTCRRARRSALDNREAVFSKGQGIFHVAKATVVPSELLFVVYFVEREPRHSATRTTRL